jgi:hypothetical protein
MINRRNSRTSLAILILCLCLGSLVILPFIPAGSSRVDAESYDPFDHAEPEVDIFVLSIIGAAIAELNYSKSRNMNLDFESTSVSPVFPPPKPS